MRKWGRFTIGGLQNKIFNLCIVLVVTAITAFAIVALLQLRAQSELSEKTGIETNNTIKEMSGNSLMNLTEISMTNIAGDSADMIDYEFWTCWHDLSLLSDMAADIIANPGVYSEIEVSEPDKKNGGEYVLQLLKADWADEKDKKAMSQVRKLANLEPMMVDIVAQNSDFLLDCYIALPSGFTLAMDDLSQFKFEEDGTVKAYDATSRQWYQGAVEEEAMFFTPAVHSFFYDLDEIAFGMPVYVGDELVCVLEGSVKLDTIREGLARLSYGETSFAILVNDNGQIIYSPYSEGELAIDDELTANVSDSANETLLEMINKGIGGESGFEPVTVNGEEYYAAYTPLETLGGACVFFTAAEEIARPTEALLEAVDGVTADSLKKYSSNFKTASWLSLLVVILLVANAVIIAIAFSTKLLRPIILMTQKVEEITGDNLVFEMVDTYRTGDEIEILAQAFGNLSEKTRQYIKELVEVTAEKERIGAELDVATRIQADMLPSDFPIYPDSHEFDLYATMTPAKEVGGDLYDVFKIDDDHLCMVVGDVAGKGVPAALFMVISKTMLKNRAQMGGTPAEIFNDVNVSLCEGNKQKMFVTVWMGILTISTGELITSSAGHEYPVIKRKDGDYELIKTKNGFVMGGMKKAKYKDENFKLEPGDTLFMYTDGLPEATNAQGEMIQTDAMIEALNRHKEDDPTELLHSMRKEVDDFVKEAPPFDDLTMFCVRYNGPVEQ